LPRIVGDGAPERARAFHAEIAAFPRLARRLAAAEFVAGRRWTLHMTGGLSVLLPSAGIKETLARLDQLQERDQILDRAAVTLDLRGSDRLFVDPRPASAAPRRLPG